MAITTVEEINKMISELPEDQKELVTDGYHSFKELYDHRVVLFIALCNTLNNIDLLLEDHNDGIVYSKKPWKSKLHFDIVRIDIKQLGRSLIL